jgi:hypothetical protein
MSKRKRGENVLKLLSLSVITVFTPIDDFRRRKNAKMMELYMHARSSKHTIKKIGEEKLHFLFLKIRNGKTIENWFKVCTYI